SVVFYLRLVVPQLRVQPRQSGQHRRPDLVQKRGWSGVGARQHVLAHRAAGDALARFDRFGPLRYHIEGRVLQAVLGLEKEPLLLPTSGPRPDQMPPALQLLAIDLEREVPLLPLGFTL